MCRPSMRYKCRQHTTRIRYSVIAIFYHFNLLVFREWRLGVKGAKGTLYEGEEFSLQFRFSSQYPFSSPEVIFFLTVLSYTGYICWG